MSNLLDNALALIAEVRTRLTEPEIHALCTAIEQEASKAESITAEADGLVHGDRGRDYGHPFDDYKRTTDIFAAWTGIHLSPQEAVQFMRCVKMSRQMQSPHVRDHYVDSAGYTDCDWMVFQETIRRKYHHVLDETDLKRRDCPLPPEPDFVMESVLVALAKILVVPRADLGGNVSAHMMELVASGLGMTIEEVFEKYGG